MKIGFKTLLLVGVLTAAAGFAGCNIGNKDSDSGNSAPASNGEVKRASLNLTIDEYPKINGSTANLPLMAEFMSRVTGIPLEEAQTRVTASKTAMAWNSMSYEDSTVDMLLVYEAPEDTKDVVEQALERWDVTPIGRDGLVFLTHKSNPVKNLESQQIKDVYTGKITNWKELGGDGLTIKAFQRNNDSGSQAMFMKLAMENQSPMEPPKDWVMGGMGELIDNVSAYDNSGGALGYSVFYYASEMYANPDLKILSVNGVEPSNKTIESGDYPYCNDFYMVTNKDISEDSPTYKLREWILSDEGRQVMTEAGYVAPKAFG